MQWNTSCCNAVSLFRCERGYARSLRARHPPALKNPFKKLLSYESRPITRCMNLKGHLTPRRGMWSRPCAPLTAARPSTHRKETFMDSNTLLAMLAGFAAAIILYHLLFEEPD